MSYWGDSATIEMSLASVANSNQGTHRVNFTKYDMCIHDIYVISLIFLPFSFYCTWFGAYKKQKAEPTWLAFSLEATLHTIVFVQVCALINDY